MSKAFKEWDTSTLGEIGLPRTPNIDPSNYPKEIFELYSVPSFSLNEPEIVPGSEIGSTKQLVEPGDVLLCKIVPHLVRVWCVPRRSTHRQIASGEWIVVRPDPAKTDKQYLRYALIEPGFRSHFMETVSGVGGSLMRARPKAVAQISVPLPAKVEQVHIVTKLDSLFKRSNSAREELAHVPRLVERYRGAVLAAAFSGQFTEGWRLKYGVSVDRNWRQTTLGAISTDVRYGTAAKCHYEPKKTPVLRIPNIVNGRIDLSDVKYASFSKQEVEKLALRAGDLLVIRSNGSLSLVGRVALVPKAVAGHLYAGYLIRIRLDPKHVYPEFVQHAFDEPTIRQHIESLAKSTSGVNNINSEQLKSIPFKIPPLEEQKEIVEKIQSAFSSIDHLRDEAIRADKLLDRLDQATLAKAFRGELMTEGESLKSGSSYVAR